MRPVCWTNVPKSPETADLSKFGRLTRFPNRVRKMLLIAPPKAAGIKKTPISAALAAILHLTQEEMASDKSADSRIHIQLPTNIAPAILRFCANQVHPSR